jgi:CBS-domain-containing membrane protein
MRSAPNPSASGPVAHPRVDERRELGRVDLDVLAAERDELLDLRAPDLGGVGEHLERVAVRRRRVRRAPEAVETSGLGTVTFSGSRARARA